jgi:hypothetical protein
MVFKRLRLPRQSDNRNIAGGNSRVKFGGDIDVNDRN